MKLILTILACAITFTSAACTSRQRPQAHAITPSLAERLVGTHWHLEDLGGAKTSDRSTMSISFPEPGRVAGHAACNNFVGGFEINDDTVKLGPLASTRKHCKPPVMKQEVAYLKALNGAERVVLQEATLMIYSTSLDKPLRYSRQ